MPFTPHPVRLLVVLSTIGVLASTGTARANCSATSLPAECLTFAFTASADTVSDPEGVFGTVGSTVSGTFTFDSSISDFFPADSAMGFYEDSLRCVSVNLGERTFYQELGFASSIAVTNDFETNFGITIIGDSYTVDMGQDDASVDGQPGNGDFLFELATVCIPDMAGTCPPTLTTSDALPTTPPDVGAFTEFDGNDFEVNFFPVLGQSTATVKGLPISLTSVAPIPCPEPTSSASAVACALSLGWIARRRLGARAANV
jgi:hypothetical protein